MILFCEPHLSGRNITNKGSSIQKRYILHFFLEVPQFMQNCATLFSFSPLIKHKYRENGADNTGEVAVATPLTSLQSCTVGACAHGKANVMWAHTAASSAPPALHSCPQGAEHSCYGTAIIGSQSALSSKRWQTQKDARHSTGGWLSAQIPFFSHACRDPVNSTEFGIIGITWYLFAFRHILNLPSACGLCSKSLLFSDS